MPRAFCIATVALLLLPVSLRANSDLLDDFEGPETSWTIVRVDKGAEVAHHHRQSKVAHGGRGAEELRVVSREVGPEVELSRSIPPARAIGEFEVSLWIRSRTKGVQLGLRVVYPHQLDPDTGKSLMALLVGPADPGLGQWQKHTIQTDEANLARTQARTRVRLAQRIDARQIDFRDPYVDQIVIFVPTTPGTCDVQWDDLSVSPIVSPETLGQVNAAGGQTVPQSQLSWADDKLLRDTRPFLARFVTYQGERLELLRDVGINAVWIDSYQDAALIKGISGEGLNVFATPPRPAESERNTEISMAPFGDETADIDCWMLGRLDFSELDQVIRWTDQIQDADRGYGRPLMGDVSGNVRHFHRHIPLLGASRHNPHTSLSPVEYAEFLEQRCLQALPGKPMSTLLPTEPSEATLASRMSADSLPVVEPETLSLCARTAVASGYKLLGFWTHTPLDDPGAGLEERRHMLRLINIELQLLEPWLAAGKRSRVADIRLPGDVPVRKKKARSLNPFRSPWDKEPSEVATVSRSPIRVTELRGESGLLILVDWLEANAQYQPGRMTAENLRFIATRFDDAQQAWEITTTELRQIPLDLQPVSGGQEVPLDRLDQHAAIVMTNSPVVIASLKRQIREVRQTAAESWVALATAKYERVEKVRAQLESLTAPKNPYAAQTMAAASRSLEEASQELKAGRFDEARRASQKVLELTRIVQRSDWELAVERLTSPVASPHAICFQTLPDHWRLMNRLQSNPPASQNLLPSGDFEDENALAAQWQFQSPHARGDTDISAEIGLLKDGAVQGRYAFQMVAKPTRADRAIVIEEPVITGLSPAMTVYAGQVVRITGRVFVNAPLTGSVDGLMIYDSLMGSVGAHRFRKQSPSGQWEPFEMFREVKQSGDLQIIFELRGLGDVRIDDVQVFATTPPYEGVAEQAAGTKRP